MQKKSTTELLKELENFSSFEEYRKANKDSLINKTLSEYLCDLLRERNLTKAEVIRKAEAGESYSYQLFSGIKCTPKRDKLICLSIGMDLTVGETNSVLKLAGLLPLYPRVKRDSIIIMNMNACKSVIEINEALYEENEETLN
ncbi:MAG: XRE family transcriptional regulator [Hominimerdicola sp.]